MRLLAFDTSTPRAAVALSRADGTILTASGNPSARHGQGLLPAIRDLLRAASMVLADLDGLAVGRGPGSYTGLRIGVIAAKTLAVAAHKPLIGLDSLEIVARNAPDDALAVSVVADAQRGDLYVADFARSEAGGPLTRIKPTRVEATDVWRAGLVAGTWVLGPAVERLDELPDAVRRAPVPRANHPEAIPLARLARELWDSGQRDDPWSLEPVYLRRAAAEVQWDARS